jgi:hypothetical protein
MSEPQLSHCLDFFIWCVVISSKMFLQCGKRDENWTAWYQNYKVDDQRQYNQGAESLHMFSHLCVVVYCHFEGAAIPREEILWSHTSSFPIVSQWCAELMVVPVGINSQVQGTVQASHHENMQPNDDYTLLSINTSICQWMSIGGTFSAVRNTITAHCFLCSDVLMLHFAVFSSTIQSSLIAKV